MPAISKPRVDALALGAVGHVLRTRRMTSSSAVSASWPSCGAWASAAESRLLAHDRVEEARRLGLQHQNRSRPIAMTTLAAILALLPLAFVIGQGSQIQQPLAVAIIAGLVVQLQLVLLAMPAFHALMRRAPSSQATSSTTPIRRGDASTLQAEARR